MNEQGSSSQRWLFVRYLAVGAMNTAFGYAVYAVLVLLGAPLWSAVGGANLLGFFFNFFSYGGLVFGRTSALLLLRFLVFYLVTGLLNLALLKLAAALDVKPLVAQAILLPILALAGFVVMRKFVFRERKSGDPRRTAETIGVHRLL
jgi:putative flippase GtrA